MKTRTKLLLIITIVIIAFMFNIFITQAFELTVLLLVFSCNLLFTKASTMKQEIFGIVYAMILSLFSALVFNRFIGYTPFVLCLGISPLIMLSLKNSSYKVKSLLGLGSSIIIIYFSYINISNFELEFIYWVFTLLSCILVLIITLSISQNNLNKSIKYFHLNIRLFIRLFILTIISTAIIFCFEWFIHSGFHTLKALESIIVFYFNFCIVYLAQFYKNNHKSSKCLESVKTKDIIKDKNNIIIIMFFLATFIIIQMSNNANIVLSIFNTTYFKIYYFNILFIGLVINISTRSKKCVKRVVEIMIICFLSVLPLIIDYNESIGTFGSSCLIQNRDYSQSKEGPFEIDICTDETGEYYGVINSSNELVFPYTKGKIMIVNQVPNNAYMFIKRFDHNVFIDLNSTVYLDYQSFYVEHQEGDNYSVFIEIGITFNAYNYNISDKKLISKPNIHR